jgi:photosystem II stability/assembly factor-like uncharacterized protein
MTELLLGTKKGLFALQGDAGAGEFEVRARAFPGEPVDFAMRDPASQRVIATVTSPFYGPKIWFADDPAGEWTQAEGVALPEGSEEALERIWVIVAGEGGSLYAGGDPGVLFESRDGGETWELNAALREHRVKDNWQPGGGGLCLHSIVPWPGEPEKLSLAVSAAGVWHTEDHGQTWTRRNQGIVPRYLPEEAREGATQLCVHRMERAARRPERLFIQFHWGVYRSDDAGQSWTEIGDALPSDFGFPLALDPADPDSAYVIPLKGDFDRVMPEGHVRVYETRDAGETWTPRGDGLPDHEAYLTVLRRAFDRTGEGRELQLYFGATSGEVFGSGDAGGRWFTAATRLPPVFSVTASA